VVNKNAVLLCLFPEFLISSFPLTDIKDNPAVNQLAAMPGGTREPLEPDCPAISSDEPALEMPVRLPVHRVKYGLHECGPVVRVDVAAELLEKIPGSGNIKAKEIGCPFADIGDAKLICGFCIELVDDTGKR